MKRLYYIVLLAALTALCAESQAQIRTAYFMEGSYFRTDMNPALAPTRGYFSLPGIGGVGLSLNNNMLSADNFFYKRDGQVVTFLNSGVSAEQFLRKIPNNGRLGLDATVNIVSFGGHTKKLYWNYGINTRVSGSMVLKKDFFRLLKSFDSGSYDMSGSGLNATAYAEMYFGMAIPIKEIATFGFRVKGLLGLAHMSADIDQMNVSFSETSARAVLSGAMRANTALLNAAAASAGDKLDFGMLFDGEDLKSIPKRLSGGAAIDLGTEIRLFDEHLKISAAVTDLGFIRWNNRSALYGGMNGDFYFNGVNLDTGEADLDSSFDAVVGSTGGGYTTMLNWSLNVGAEYNILNNHIAFGLLSHTQFCNRMAFPELTASVNFRIGKFFTTTFSHTFLGKNEPGVLGFALNLHPAGLNLFLGADYIDTRWGYVSSGNDRLTPIPRYQKSLNFYFGLGFNLGRAKYMKSMQPSAKRQAKLDQKAADKAAKKALRKAK